LERKGTSQCPKQYQIALHQRSSITVGDLTYSLIFTKLSQTQQEQELREAQANFVDSASPGPTAAMFLSPTPLKQTTDYHGYVLYNPTTGGATSVVSLGYSESTGELVIIKKMKQTKNNNENVKSEIAMLRLLNHVCKLVYGAVMYPLTCYVGQHLQAQGCYRSQRGETPLQVPR
jgi:hypothetical protein